MGFLSSGDGTAERDRIILERGGGGTGDQVFGIAPMPERGWRRGERTRKDGNEKEWKRGITRKCRSPVDLAENAGKGACRPSSGS